MFASFRNEELREFRGLGEIRKEDASDVSRGPIAVLSSEARNIQLENDDIFQEIDDSL